MEYGSHLLQVALILTGDDTFFWACGERSFMQNHEAQENTNKLGVLEQSADSER